MGILNLRVVVNTILMLLSVRFLLSALGLVDYGLYAVVAGITVFLGFITSSMAISFQRHLTVALGKGDKYELRALFNTGIGLHFILAILLVIFVGFLGSWLLSEVLNIPENRKTASFWVFRFTLISSAFSAMVVPFQAMLIAHEDFLKISMIDIGQSVCTFIIALTLKAYGGDRLIAYGLLSSSTIVLAVSARMYLAVSGYSAARLKVYEMFNLSRSRELLSFSGWNLFGSLSIVARLQGVAFILNGFYGPVTNAAFGLANQVNSSIKQFSQSVIEAASPYLMKKEGAGGRSSMLANSVLSCKYSFFVAVVLMLPLWFELPYVLNLWLDSIPANTIVFCRIILIIFVIDQLSASLAISLMAIGKIGLYQTVVGLVHLATLPLAYYAASSGGREIDILWIAMLTATVAAMLRGRFLSRVSEFAYLDWIKLAVLPAVYVIVPMATISALVVSNLPESLFRLLVTIGLSTSVAILVMPLLGMSRSERGYIWRALPASIKKLKSRVS